MSMIVSSSSHVDVDVDVGGVERSLMSGDKFCDFAKIGAWEASREQGCSWEIRRALPSAGSPIPPKYRFMVQTLHTTNKR